MSDVFPIKFLLIRYPTWIVAFIVSYYYVELYYIYSVGPLDEDTLKVLNLMKSPNDVTNKDIKKSGQPRALN